MTLPSMETLSDAGIFLNYITTDAFWIGGYNYEDDKKWRWIGNGQEIANTYLYRIKPSNLGNCFYIRKWSWLNANCNNKNQYLCERKFR